MPLKMSQSAPLSGDIHHVDLGVAGVAGLAAEKSEECPVATTLRKLSLHVDVASCHTAYKEQGVWKGRFYVTRCDVVS